MNTLQQRVIEQLGYDELDDDCKSTLSDIVNHGIDSGFHGFIYHTDTIQFFDDNRVLILNELNELAYDIGESAIEVAQSFRCLNGDYDREVEQVLMDLPCEDDTQIKNALAWFAAEQVAYQLENEL